MAIGDGFEATALSTTSSSDDATPREAANQYLLVFDASSTHMFPLPRDGEIDIGRHPSSALRLDESSVSRHHAKLVIAGGEVTLVDLGSQNGTRVNGTRVAGQQRLVSADMIAIGAATLVFHADTEATPEDTARVLEFPQWRRRLDEEVERSIRFHRTFGLLCIHLGETIGEREVIEAALEHRRLDIATWSGADELLVLLPETNAQEVALACARLRTAIQPIAAAVRIGHVVCPDHGTDADGLAAAARAGAMSAKKGEIVAATPTARTIELGDKKVVVADAAMIRLYAMIDRLAASELPVLLTGETGTGKEIATTAIHLRSPRKTRPLVTLNCAAIQETLVESELFGYERGAFSGAVNAKPGLFEVASGGTIFLDEIGELSPSTQAKLLRALETKRITRLGDLREREIDIRLLAATNRDLLQEVEAGRFRRDLYFRLSGAVIAIPPLRKRMTELPLLAQTFLDEACARAKRAPMTISPSAIAMMRAHAWPGNLRELKNLMDYAAVAFGDRVLEPSHIVERLGAKRAQTAPVAEPFVATPGKVTFRPLNEELEEIEKLRISEALAATNGNHAQAARLLDVPLRTFFNKVKRYGLGAKD